jgi:hypothetical protein
MPFAMMLEYLLDPTVVSKQQKGLTSLSVRGTIYRKLKGA